MARIYKESRYVLQLLIGKSYGAQYEDVKISFYTKNPNNQVMADDDITIKGNVAEVMVDSTLFDNLEEGLIKYIVYGTKDGIPFIEERQSNYFLKTPLDFKPTTCILEDKSVTPSMGERNDDGLIVVSPSEGYDGLKRTVIDPQTIYNEGVEAGRAEGGEGGCTLISRTFTSNGVYHPEALQMPVIWFTSDKPSAYDTGIKLVNDSWVEIYFRATEGGDTPTLIGCEEGDWNNTAFATRWYNNNLGVKIGLNEIGIPYTANDGALHKLKFGKTVGVWFDDVKVSDIAGEEWTPTDRTIYIGAMNDPSNNNEKGFWRYWVGFIGDVTIYGSLNENVGEYHFKAGDYGRWGEFKRVEDNTNLPNLGGDGMAIAQIGSYGEAPDGFSEVTVNVLQHNLGTLDWTLTSPSTEVKNASDDGYDGYSQVTIRPENVIAQAKENAVNDFKNKMKEITITQNGTYSIDDQVTRQYVEFDGNSYFDTGIVPTENAKVEVAITKTTYEEDEQFIGCAHYDFSIADTYGGFGLVAGAGLTYGVFGKAKTNNITFSMEEEQILTLDRTGLESSLYGRVGWIDDSADFNYVPGRTIAIGKINSSDGWMYRGLKGRIRYVKIWTNKDDDSTMTLFQPKNMAQGGFGMVNSEGTEYNYIENIGEGTATFVEENVKKYPNGFKRVEVNVVPQISIKEAGLNVWYNDLTRITDENNYINSDWDLALKGETIQNVFPGIAFTISGQAVAKPFFINAVNGNSTATRIGKLVSSAYGTPVSCAVVIIGAFDCKNIQNVDIEAFKYMTDLCFIDGMNGLGESFISPQTINFTYCTNLFIKANNKKYISNFAESLFDLSTGNKNSINTSTLKFKSAVQERSENADAIALMRSKGWTVEFVSSDL